MANSSAAAAPVHRRMFKHPGRVAVVAVTLLVVLNLGFVLLNESDTTPGGSNPLPAAVTAVSPEPNSIASPVDSVTVDLDDSFTGVLLIRQNGRYIEIPEDQLSREESLSQILFRPGPGKDITRFAAGPVDVVVLYWPKARAFRPKNPSSYSWSFQVKA
jgi:hypothetical protein